MSAASNTDPAVVPQPAAKAEDLHAAIQSHGSCVAGYLRARLTDPDIAARLTHEVFLRFAGQRHRAGDVASTRRDLLQTARVLLERHADEWTSLCLELEPDVTDATIDRTASVTTAMQSLEPAEREAIVLAYGAGSTGPQIGERMRRSEGAVRQLLFRARQKLQEALS